MSKIEQDKFKQLVEIVRKLRSPDGCPWDREQTHKSLRPYLIEEVYELVDSIDTDDKKAIREELGDIMLHVLFHTDICAEEGIFDIDDVISHITEKLIRRHPHVFGDIEVSGTGEVLHNWEQIKLSERKEGNDDASLLDGVPHSMAALLIAQRMQEKAARIGFDWEKIEDVWAKINEEIGELNELIVNEKDGRIGIPACPHHKIEEEIGDVIFAIVNFARFMNINAEMALRHTNSKFARRFKYIEKKLREHNIENPTLEIMDKFWDEAKGFED